MAKCGYHPRMGVGLKEIGGGLADAVGLKALTHSRSASDQLAAEQEEFAVVREVVRQRVRQTPNKDERLRLEAFDAMLCLGEYFLNLQNTTKCTDLQSEVDDRTSTFIAFLQDFDKIWKNELLSKSLVERAENAMSCFNGKRGRAAA
jgi:hypothetical protein